MKLKVESESIIASGLSGAITDINLLIEGTIISCSKDSVLRQWDYE